MSFGGTKKTSSKQTQSGHSSIDAVLESRGDRNNALAQMAAALGFQPNRGVTVAGFTPMQQAAFQNVNNAAGAFGMAMPSSPMAGVPATQTQGGIAGYTTAPHYDAMVAALPPGYRAALESLFLDPQTGQGPEWAMTQLTPDNPHQEWYATRREPGTGYIGGSYSLFGPGYGNAPQAQPTFSTVSSHPLSDLLGGNPAPPGLNSGNFGRGGA